MKGNHKYERIRKFRKEKKRENEANYKVNPKI